MRVPSSRSSKLPYEEEEEIEGLRFFEGSAKPAGLERCLVLHGHVDRRRTTWKLY